MPDSPKPSSANQDTELPGMWERADFEGGDPDERSYAERERTNPQCTGISATWCPIHGDCLCPVHGSGHWTRIDTPTLNDERCPLHASSSSHSLAVLDAR